jgi:hypothetical protein
MTSLATASRPVTRNRINRKPAVPAFPAWEWLCRPTNGQGFLAIAGTTYMTRETQFEHDNGMGGRLWELRKADGTAYTLTVNADAELACDCPDATYRHRECKHVTSLKAALAELDRRAALDRWLGAMEPVPADAPF